MRLAAILCLALCAPCVAQEPVIALNAEDAATCATGCTMITPAALNAGAPLALWVVGHTMPPVALTVDGL